ncbi:MAG: Glycosyltransferase [Parcubacteria group bacterium GW2011_GWA1_40_21]|nr:MAG: Glycosyltransferase [Parcubacteria group bacterium GW2011_GWA1_40_21]
MKILIATGIYPPDIGGPAQYAKNIETVWRNQGHTVKVLSFLFERKLPTGIRHIWYGSRLLFQMIGSDMVIALDTFSAGVPAVFMAKILRRKIIARTGGDFLWEAYVERTGDLALLRNFYDTCMNKLSRKERMIFRLTRYMLTHADGIVFSTAWQRNIFIPAYGIDSKKTHIVENYYGKKEESFNPVRKNFIAGTRLLKWKNLDRVREVFASEDVKRAGVVFEENSEKFEKFMDRISNCYAVVLASLGDISPNMILDAIRYNKPFILTKETGLYERLKGIAIFVDPENDNDIKEKILFLADDKNYQASADKVATFSFTHSWLEICDELMKIYKNLL